MNKIVCSMIGVGLVSCALAQEPAVPLEPINNVNLVKNPDFEDRDSTVWKLGKYMTVEDGIGRNGSRGVRWKSTDASCRDSRLTQDGIPAEPGRIYSYEGWIKLGGGLTNGPVYFNMVCLTRDGKWLASVEGRPLIRQPQLKGKGWVRVSGATARTPVGTAFVSVSCHPPFNCTGEVFIDDFKVTASEKRYVEHVYTSAYRDLAVDGKVKFSAPYICSPEECPAADLAPEFVFKGADGRECRVRADRVGEDEPKETSFEATIDVSRFAMGTQNVRAELRTKGGKVLDAAEVAFTRAATRPDLKVWFDSLKRPIVDGKPFFPLGMYFGRIEKKELGIYKQAAFNTVFCDGSLKSLDVVQSYGLKGIVDTASCVDPERLARKLRELKDHPAVLAWYTNDEMPPGLAPRQAMLQKAYRSADPDHPTFTVLDKPWQVRIFMPTFDVIGMDPYPVGNHRGGIDIAYGWAASCARQSFGMRPMWQVPQAFDWRWYRDGLDDPEFRFPTREEFRSMTWQAIAAGANGLVYYSFGSMRKRLKAPGEFDRHWSYVKDVVAEVAKHVPVILSDGEPPQVDGATEAVPVRAWRNKDGIWLLAVNTMRNAQKVTLSVEGAPAKAQAMQVAFGPAPEISPDGKLSFSFKPLEQTLLRLSSGALAAELRPVPNEPINIDVGRQLFLDDRLVETSTMKRKWIEPTIDPRSPVLRPETELERSNNTKDPNWNALSAPFSGGVWYDGQDKLYKCWYLAGWANGIAYATSTDGITWIRPDLDGKGNNLTYRTRGLCDSNSILLDPDCTDGYRWKGFAFDLGRAPEPLNNPTPERRMMGASVAVSKDGIHWTEPEQASRTGDRTTAFYNPFIRKWVYSVRSGRTENGLQMGRWRDYAEGDDFIQGAKNMKRRNWRLKGSAGGRQVNGQELYNFDAVAYESVMIGLALIYNSPQNTYWDKRGLPKIADLKLGFNTTPEEYDTWQFPWVNEHDGFFLSGTRKYGDWNMGYLQSNSAICIVHGDELWFYFSAFAGQPDKPKEFRHVNQKSGTYANGTMGIAKLRRDGFCSLSDGTITTRRLVFTQGDRLWINADVRAGELKVESSGGLSRTFKGVDSTRLEVGRLDPGMEFTLTFTATGGAKLYSFWASDAKGRSRGYLAGGSPESDTLRDLEGASPADTEGASKKGR